MNKKAFVLGFAVAAAGLAIPATAQDVTNRVAADTDWAVFEADAPRECWAVTAPKETVNTRDGRVVSVRRGDIYLYVTYRPGENVTGQVAFTGGYPFADDSTATLKIGDSDFPLVTDGEYAWPKDAQADREVVAALKRGQDAVITARSSRGTQTQDTFSLMGATAMIEDAASRCTG